MDTNQQQTLATGFERSGVGLHSGIVTQVRVLPAPPGQGRYFVRVDLPDQPSIPAQVAYVSQTLLSTELCDGDASVRTVEHLLAALAGMEIDNARIEVDGAELPVLDGSAQEWTTAIAQAGKTPQAATREPYRVSEPIWIHQGDAFVAALPSATKPCLPVCWHTAPQPSGACHAYHELLENCLDSWLSGFVLATATPAVKLAFHPYVVVNSLMTCALRLTTRLS